MSVTVNKGALLSQKYKGSTISNDAIELVGTEMVIRDKKVTTYNGSVLKKDTKERIGNFNYQNGESSEGMGDNYYNCSIAITVSEYARLQISAITSLLDGITQFESEEV